MRVGQLNRGSTDIGNLREQVLRRVLRLQAHVPVGLVCGHAAARGAHQEALLDQVRFDHVFQRATFLGQRRGQRFDAHRATIEVIDHGLQQAPIELVEALRVNLQHLHRGLRDSLVDVATGLDLGIVAHAAQQAVGDTRRATRAARDLASAIGGAVDAEDAGRAAHDPGQLFDAVELQALDDAEAVAQRRGRS
ncbi:hypothetical protein G6F31_018429 [Rhizopus arrhizus]|nr:hypothetical protein G6F31_018429 [Rhizopus arrhizus]